MASPIEASLMQVFIDRNAFVSDAQGLSVLRGLTAEESEFYLRYTCGRSGVDWCTAQSIGRYYVLSQRHERAMRERPAAERPRLPQAQAYSRPPAQPLSQSLPIPPAVAALAEFHGGNLVLAWRIHLKLTQKEVAQKMGLQQSAFSKIERGESRRLRRNTLARIAGAMNLSPEQLGTYPVKTASARQMATEADSDTYQS